MLEHFNHEMRLVGETASGHFCASFGLSGRCIKELASIKSLAYDGWFIKRYAVELESIMVNSMIMSKKPCHHHGTLRPWQG
jgi:hypothetical protein